MVHAKTFEPKFKRRRTGQTNYAKRLALLQSGKARLVVRRRANSIVVELVSFDPNGDKVIAYANSAELKKWGWKLHGGNLPAAYLTGLLCAKRAKKGGVVEAVADIGSHSAVKGSAPFAAVKGAMEGGLAVPVDEGVLPGEDRVSGKIVSDYAKQLGGSWKNSFSQYHARGISPSDVVEHIASVKKKLLEEMGERE